MMYEVTSEDCSFATKILENLANQLRIISCLREEECNKNLWNFVLNSLLITIEELKSKNTFTFLATIVERERQKRSENYGSTSNLNKCEYELSRLNDQIADTMSSCQAELKLKNRIIEEQIEELQNLKTRNESEFEFQKKWLAIQIEETDLKCELEEADIRKCVANLVDDIEEEKKVHEELLWYYNNEQNHVEDLIIYWKKRFEDIEQRKTEIAILCTKQKAQHDELEHFKCMFYKRNEEMEEYLADKERRRKEYEYEQYRHKMATKIQAWWRGVMVRRGLGPFKSFLKAKNLKKRKMSLKKSNKK